CSLLAADDDIGMKSKESMGAEEKGFKWLATNFALSSSQSSFYNLHAIARLGTLSGHRNLGEHDWFQEGAKWLLPRRNDDGSFSGEASIDKEKVLATSFALMFLNSAPQHARKTERPKNRLQPVDAQAAIEKLAAQADRIVVATASDVPDS